MPANASGQAAALSPGSARGQALVLQAGHDRMLHRPVEHLARERRVVAAELHLLYRKRRELALRGELALEHREGVDEVALDRGLHLWMRVEPRAPCREVVEAELPMED